MRKQLCITNDHGWCVELLEDPFSIIMTRSGIGEMLKRRGFGYTRTAYRLVRANPKKQEAFLLGADMIKNSLTT